MFDMVVAGRIVGTEEDGTPDVAIMMVEPSHRQGHRAG
ncbi:polyribonucleotide nucleotidyltransferase domain protein [Mycobacterium ulcerans str. Harvey]|uniref:Polyribonucleotide nucleotidyltransferase domain protein n=1 Tax=Mycobacterium ulcerans str. Harvey TaxID=1299332 RepID=A0ABN0QZB6_MYCUL|nr:polyribonucleotide nucleotidyltransferase domain protein [Mycobacterium ulcerans str. Harvey]